MNHLYQANIKFVSTEQFSTILQWAVNTFTNDDERWSFMIGYHKTIYSFRDESDLTLFLLRWSDFCHNG